MDASQICIQKYGAEKAVAMALAYMSGNYIEIKNRSLLNGSEDFITYKVETTTEFNTVSYIWGILRKIVSPEIVETVKCMRCFASNKGAAFDIPEKYSQILEESYKKEMTRYSHINYKLEKATALPDLKEPVDIKFNGYSRNNGGRTYGGYNKTDGHTSYGHHSEGNRYNYRDSHSSGHKSSEGKKIYPAHTHSSYHSSK